MTQRRSVDQPAAGFGQSGVQDMRAGKSAGASEHGQADGISHNGSRQRLASTFTGCQPGLRQPHRTGAQTLDEDKERACRLTARSSTTIQLPGQR